MALRRSARAEIGRRDATGERHYEGAGLVETGDPFDATLSVRRTMSRRSALPDPGTLHYGEGIQGNLIGIHGGGVRSFPAANLIARKNGLKGLLCMRRLRDEQAALRQLAELGSRSTGIITTLELTRDVAREVFARATERREKPL